MENQDHDHNLTIRAGHIDKLGNLDTVHLIYNVIHLINLELFYHRNSIPKMYKIIVRLTNKDGIEKKDDNLKVGDNINLTFQYF